MNNFEARFLCLLLVLGGAPWSGDVRAKENVCRFAQFFGRLKKLIPAESVDTASNGPVDAFSVLQNKGAFLEQDANYLAENCLGGTCASVISVNHMLVMAETLMPGSISKLSKSAIRNLHKQLLTENLLALKKLHGINGTQGAPLENFTDVYPYVLQKVFHTPLANDVSVIHTGPHDFQSILPGKDSLLTLSVRTNTGKYHAIAATAIKPPPKATRENPVPESFIVTISDPHSPGKLRDLKVYEYRNNFFLEGYGNSQITVHSYDQTFSINAGLIRTGILINFRRYQPTRTWTTQDIDSMIPKDRATLRVKIKLKDGSVYNNVAITHSDSADNVNFFHTFELKKSVPLSEVADIQSMADMKAF